LSRAAAWPWWSASGESTNSIDSVAPNAPSAKTDDLTYEMVLPDSGLDPLATSPTADAPYSIYLPLLAR
jgi:hypothetical protein